MLKKELKHFRSIRAPASLKRGIVDAGTFCVAPFPEHPCSGLIEARTRTSSITSLPDISGASVLRPH